MKRNMSKKEALLFKELCSYKKHNFDDSLLEAMSPNVLGQLFFNRMAAVAYSRLKEKNLLGKIHREVKNSLAMSYKTNIEKNKDYFKCVRYLSDILIPANGKYAMLKGAALSAYYEEGLRTSSDIDLLVSPDDVTEISTLLKDNGFVQGSIKNNIFVPASRKEIIESKMMRGETIPYIKEINCNYIKFLEVDLNFSLDYKNSEFDSISNMMNSVSCKNIGQIQIQTLNDVNFFIHLCCHLYKEATTMPWIEMKRDMTLYKYFDIYMLVSEMDSNVIDAIFQSAKTLNLEKICAFCIIQMDELFWNENEYALKTAKSILSNDQDFIHCVVSPNKKRYIYNEYNIQNRFFSNNRKELLKEKNT